MARPLPKASSGSLRKLDEPLIASFAQLGKCELELARDLQRLAPDPADHLHPLERLALAGDDEAAARGLPEQRQSRWQVDDGADRASQATFGDRHREAALRHGLCI